MELTSTQKEMAKILVDCALHRKDICYKDLGKLTGVFWRQVGRQAGAVSEKCLELGLPAISVLVVGKQSRKPGVGFIPLLKKRGYVLDKDNNDTVIQQEKEKVFLRKDWSVLIGQQSVLNPYLDEIENETFHEGAKKQITVNYYERDPRARLECIDSHKPSYTCYICGFNSGEIYGEQFKGLIHVHHKVPLSKIQGETKNNPKIDMVPVCPNCHMILHSKGKGEVYDVEDIKLIYSRNKINKRK